MADYTTEITDDPVYRAALASYNANTQQGRNSLRDSMRQLVIASGIDPTGQIPGDLAGYAADLDKGTLDVAAQNPFSTMAGLRNALAGGQQNLRYALAARGIGGSGGEASGQSVLNMNYQQGTNEALQKLLGDLRSGVGSYTGLVGTEQGKLSTSMSDVAARLAQQQGPTYTDPATGTTTDPVTGATTGKAAAGFKWGGKTFTTKSAFGQYLKGRGGNLGAWGKAHPTAFAGLK